MGKSDTSAKWFIRVTAPWEHIATKYLELRSKVDYVASVIGYHIGKKTSKPHAHIVLEMRSTVQKQSVDLRMKQLFGIKGSDYSSKVWDGNHNAISYLHHDDGGKVEYHMDLTDAEKASILTVSTVYADIVTVAKDKASNRMVDVLLEDIKKDGHPWTVRQIATAIYAGVQAKRWYSPGYRMTNYVEEIIARQYTDDTGVAFLADKFTAKFNS